MAFIAAFLHLPVGHLEKKTFHFSCEKQLKLCIFPSWFALPMRDSGIWLAFFLKKNLPLFHTSSL